MSQPRPILLKNGRLLCPASKTDETGDLLLDSGTIAALGGELEAPADAEIIDCTDKWIAPGLIDMHVHLREPGHEYKEDIASGTAAAAAGGFTAVCCMPNTKPVNDCAAVTEMILERARKVGSCRVYPVGAITPGLKGEGLTQMAELKDAGCVAVSDDGHPVSDSRLLRRAMEYASGFDLPVICHSEETSLSAGGSMHEGPTSTALGLPGIPAEAEVSAVERDLSLAGLTGARVHIAHISCAGSVAALKRAQEAGWTVSGETAPHYLALCDQDVGEYDTHRKMNPPLRSVADREAVREALASGLIQALATDHAPHSVLEKELEFGFAAFGVTGLETALGIMLELVEDHLLKPLSLIERMSTAPARLLGLPGGSLNAGGPADVVVIDPKAAWTVDPAKMRSKSANTAFAGRKLPGRAVLTVCGGQVTYRTES
ncbi:MAG: dihydroorotase [Deltaproteobacteria bacterium]|nr:dihydroorotase [Deltaproteobacteria bacterium]